MPRLKENYRAPANLENVTARPGKGAVPKPAVKLRRPALGDLGNRIQNANTGAPKAPAPQRKVEKEVPAPLLITSTPKKAEPGAVKEGKSEVIAYSANRLKDVEEQAEGSDPQLVAEYVEDIYRYLLSLEEKYSVQSNFLKHHNVTPRMRSVLLNWMVEAHRDFSFQPETLQLSISLVDHFLQANQSVTRKNLQLVGVGALFVAAKYEEQYLPNLRDFVYIADNAFGDRDLLQMEQRILKSADWGLGRPHGTHFLKCYSKIAAAKPKAYAMAKYLLELGLLQYELCHVRPSLLAAAALSLSQAILEDLVNPSLAWSVRLAGRSGYQYVDFRQAVIGLAQALIREEGTPYQAVRTKYAAEKFWRISQHQKLRCTMVKGLALKSMKGG